ncbi:MAG TPA: hypothetical protein VJS64_17210 [Pyrinomonadaceae bacterium]|nr:hypothetical protein [Pyrinomonadaceae bacterium]
MKKDTKRLLGSLALVAGAVGAATAVLKRRNGLKAKLQREPNHSDVWARPGMIVTFRAELMPGRDREERSFRVKELLSSGRVILEGVSGEHAEKEFTAVR